MRKTVRASISFPSDTYRALERIAKQKRVSLAWVVRDAAENYVADEVGQGVGMHKPEDATATGKAR